MSKIAVIGAGAWGTTLAILLAENKHEVTLWAFEKELAERMKKRRENKTFLPGFPLSANIEIISELAKLPAAEIYFLVVPSQHLRGVVKEGQKYFSTDGLIICASKGIEEKTLNLPLEILAAELGNRTLGVLSGPNLSQEIAQGLPAATVIASNDPAAAKKVQQALMSSRFRVYTNNDPVGVQLGGSLKNVIAIAAGIVDEMKLGQNAKSALMIRAMAEITRLGLAMGGKAETFAGLSGLGDLITTCSSPLSRNNTVGRQLAKGKSLSEIVKKSTHIAEGIKTAAATVELAKKFGVELPICEQVYAVLYRGKKPAAAINDLMTRGAKGE